MSATAEPASTARAHSGISFGRLVKVEFRKMTDTRAGKTLAIVTGLVLIATALIMDLIVAFNEGANFAASAFAAALQFTSLLIVPVFAILITTSEWSQRTHLTTFTLEPNRSRVLAAKLVAVLVFALVTLLVAIAAGAIGTATTSLLGRTPEWDVTAGGLAWSATLQIALVLSAFGLGLLFLNSAAAVAVFYVGAILLRWIVWPIVGQLATWTGKVVPYIDVYFGMLTARFGTDFSTATDGELTGISRFAPVVVAIIIWVVVPIALGWIRALRSELK